MDLITRFNVGQQCQGRDRSPGVSVFRVELAVVRQDKLQEHVIMEVGLDCLIEVDDDLRLARYPREGR